jgi:hypothetical protein
MSAALSSAISAAFASLAPGLTLPGLPGAHVPPLPAPRLPAPPLNRDAFGCVAVLRVQPGVSLVDGEGMGAPAGTRVAEKSADVEIRYLFLLGGWSTHVGP